MTPTAAPVLPDHPPESPAATPTVWGLDPVRLHDRFWAARGVCVVRPGRRTELTQDAELYLLADAGTLTVFRLRPLIETIYWTEPHIIFIRLSGGKSSGYREVIISDDDRFVRFERRYDKAIPRLARVALTRDRRVAETWQETQGMHRTWRTLRNQTRRYQRETASVKARCYDAENPQEVAELVSEIIRLWPKPASTIPGLKQHTPGVWRHPSSQITPGSRLIGPVWIGAGRTVPADASIIGPAALWDAPDARPAAHEPEWQDIEPADWTRIIQPAARTSRWRRFSQRAMDLAIAVPFLAFAVPVLFPPLMLAIWLEDGRPLFFGHTRETVGGREFKCLKFRSMRTDADAIKQQLLKENQSDGPQFFIENDPRVTRVGRIMRKLNLDELPQFINVLMGDMSVVGPRPSPHAENQYCPPWREARLSVRPGVTGLWQVNRTRQAGLDFQEWIKYDMEYVQNASLWLDIKIILKQVRVILKG